MQVLELIAEKMEALERELLAHFAVLLGKTLDAGPGIGAAP